MLPFIELSFPGINPVALHLGPIEVRWYGLGYLFAFLIAGWVFDKLARDGFLPLTRHSITDLIGVCVLGVMVGGRLGYALFYEPSMFLRPLDLVRVWRGGLSFHGGLIGVVLGTMVFARRKQIPWPRLADSMVLAAPFGILLVRCANFINGELYGRLAPESLPWAVRFPTDPLARALSPELARGGSLNWYPAFDRLRDSGEWHRIAENVPTRHPSQLYEALLEGALIAIVLWSVYRRADKRTSGQADENIVRLSAGPFVRPGFFAILFLVLYASCRFIAEFFRQPDAQLGFVLGPLSMGQLLSAGVGIAGLAWGYVMKKRL